MKLWNFSLTRSFWIGFDMNQLLRKWFKYSTAGPSLTRFYLLPHIKLHYIHTSDTAFHNHPWSALSIIFGSYYEAVENGPFRRRFAVNFIPANRYHKIQVDKPVWTLFINGPRNNEAWQYGSSVKPWEGSNQERSRP